MKGNFVFRLVVTDDEGSPVGETHLSYQSVCSIIDGLPDSLLITKIYWAASMHPAPAVRERVSCKEKLSEDVFRVLAMDESIAVLQNLTRTKAFAKYADLALVHRLINLDSECAQNIAQRVEELEQVDSEVVIGELLNSPDPAIRQALVNNWSVPKRFAKMLLDDRDQQVADDARSRLE